MYKLSIAIKLVLKAFIHSSSGLPSSECHVCLKREAFWSHSKIVNLTTFPFLSHTRHMRKYGDLKSDRPLYFEGFSCFRSLWIRKLVLGLPFLCVDLISTKNGFASFIHIQYLNGFFIIIQ